jgi:nitrate reductase cytochrome c-type subunit
VCVGGAVPRGQGQDEAVSDGLLAEVEVAADVERHGTVGLGQHRVNVLLQLRIEALEQVLEQERKQLPRPIQPPTIPHTTAHPPHPAPP